MHCVCHSSCANANFSLVLQRGKYQGIIGVFVALGNGIGPLIGGVLSEKVSWRVSLATKASLSFILIHIN